MTVLVGAALIAGSAATVASLSGPVLAQGTAQTLSLGTLGKIDPATVATGYRASKIVGSSVVNGAGESVGTVDDLIVSPNEKVPFAVLAVGGYLGVGTKDVQVPYSSLVVKDNKVILADGTKESLKALPAFTLSTGDRKSSKVLGSSVYNGAGETVGTIDDLIVVPNEKVPYAVLSIGGFLGIGSKYVVVPYATIDLKDKKLVIQDATKETLKSLPEFKYSK